MFFILILLSGLAYGSYAFGKYVLSAKLFDDEVVPKPSSGLRAVSQSTKVAETITRQNNQKGRTPRVQVKVLSVDDTGPGPEPPAISEDDDSTPRTGARHSTLDNSSDEGSSSVGSTNRPLSRITPLPTPKPLGHRSFDTGRLSVDDEGETPRRRRRRRRRSAESTSTTLQAQRASDSSSTSEGSPARAESDDASDSSHSSTSSSSESSSGGRSSTDRSRSRRRRTTSSEGRRTRSESPIPRPESSSGGGSDDDSSSPLPQPE